MVGYLQPLAHNFAIVNELGYPTEYFIRWAQQKQIDIGEAVDEGRALEIVKTFLIEHPLQAGSGIDLTPDGDLNNSPTISAKAQEILDQIATTQGSVLFRGAAGWEALPPGTSTQYLKSGGPAANPLWGTPSGGGGGGDWWFNPPSTTDFDPVGSTPYLETSNDSDVGMILKFTGGTVNKMVTCKISDHVIESGDWVITSKLNVFLPSIGNANIGMVLRDPATGRFYLFGAGNGSTYYIDLTRWSSLTAYSSRITNLGVGFIDTRGWYRIRKASGNYSFELSPDGKTWVNWWSLPTTDYLSSSGLEVGFTIFSSAGAVTGSCANFSIVQI